MADAWQPATELERRMDAALYSGRQEAYFRLLADAEFVIPIAPELIEAVLADQARLTWPVGVEDGRTHVHVYTSPQAMRACLGDRFEHFLTLTFREIADAWPDPRWWLMIDPGLPIQGHLPAWFVRQIIEGDPLPPLAGTTRPPALQRSAGDSAVAAPAGQNAAAGPVPTAPAGSAVAAGAAGAAGPGGPGLPAVPGPQGAGPRGAAPHGAAPHGAAPHGTGPQPLAETTTGAADAADVAQPAFEPANDVERALLGAIAAGDENAFLQILAGAEAVVPIPPDMDYTLRPGRPGFPWQTREIDGRTVLPVFTSPERMRDATGSSGPPVPLPGVGDFMKFPVTTVLRYWPDAALDLVVNPGGPVAGAVPGARLTALSEWADQQKIRQMVEGFEPQNELEQRLFEAAVRNDPEGFLQILLSAQVLVPSEPDTPWGIRPDEAEFPWHAVAVQGRPSVQLFTSLKWMHEAIGSSRFVMPGFAEIITAWPDTEWTLILNPGTPVSTVLPGEQVRALAASGAATAAATEQEGAPPSLAAPQRAPESAVPEPTAPDAGAVPQTAPQTAPPVAPTADEAAGPATSAETVPPTGAVPAAEHPPGAEQTPPVPPVPPAGQIPPVPAAEPAAPPAVPPASGVRGAPASAAAAPATVASNGAATSKQSIADLLGAVPSSPEHAERAAATSDPAETSLDLRPITDLPPDTEPAPEPPPVAGASSGPMPVPAEPDVPPAAETAEPPAHRPVASQAQVEAPPGVPVAEPPAEFEPGNRIDQDLFEAAVTGDTDAFLRVLLRANVLVPAADDAPLEITPAQPEFRWDAALRGQDTVQVFTSLLRLRETLGQGLDETQPPPRFVYIDFKELIACWPRSDWDMALNPGTRIGASLKGDQIQALSEWAARVGLIQPPARRDTTAEGPGGPAGSGAGTGVPVDAAVPADAGTEIGGATRGPVPTAAEREPEPAGASEASRVAGVAAVPYAAPHAEPETVPGPGPGAFTDTYAGPQADAPAEPDDGEAGPTPPTVLQKVVPPAHVGWYLEQGYDRVGGFVHPAADVSDLQTPVQLYQALGLFYEDSPFTPDDEGVYVIRWPAYCEQIYRIPFGGQSEEDLAPWGDAGWVVERAPFTGNGFAAGSAGTIREFKVDSARLPYGAEMYYLGRDRSEQFIAVYDPDRLAWLRPEAAVVDAAGGTVGGGEADGPGRTEAAQ